MYDTGLTYFATLNVWPHVSAILKKARTAMYSTNVGSVTLTFSIVPITFLFSFFNKDDCSVSMNLSRCFACFGLRAL